MTLFWLLILAHFIADFPLQSDKIFALKSKYRWGLLPHILISFLSNIIIAFPYIKNETFWLAILFLAGMHFLLDWLKIKSTQNFLRDSMFIFLLDQLLHIFFIWLTCFYLFPIPRPEINNQFIATYYLNIKLMLILSGLVFSIFGGGVLTHYIRKIVYQIKIKEFGEQIVFPDPNKRRIGYVERFFSTLGTIFGGWFLVFIPLAFIPRLIIHRKTDCREFLMINLGSGLAISVGIGLFVRFLF